VSRSIGREKDEGQSPLIDAGVQSRKWGEKEKEVLQSRPKKTSWTQKPVGKGSDKVKDSSYERKESPGEEYGKGGILQTFDLQRSYGNVLQRKKRTKGKRGKPKSTHAPSKKHQIL